MKRSHRDTIIPLFCLRMVVCGNLGPKILQPLVTNTLKLAEQKDGISLDSPQHYFATDLTIPSYLKITYYVK